MNMQIEMNKKFLWSICPFRNLKQPFPTNEIFLDEFIENSIQLILKNRKDIIDPVIFEQNTRKNKDELNRLVEQTFRKEGWYIIPIIESSKKGFEIIGIKILENLFYEND